MQKKNTSTAEFPRKKYHLRVQADTFNPHFSQPFGFERLFCPAAAFSALFVLNV